MAILNRDLDPSEQKELFRYAGSTQITTGNTQWIGIIPYPCTVQSARSVAVGLSLVPIVQLQVQRFAPGNTVINLGISGMVLNAFGTCSSRIDSFEPSIGRYPHVRNARKHSSCIATRT